VIAGNPFLTNPGLLFSTPNGKAIEINLFSNGPSSPVPNGTYQLYESDYNSFGANVLGNATISPTPVPEASTVLAGALMLLPFGVSTIRIIRKRVIA